MDPATLLPAVLDALDHAGLGIVAFAYRDGTTEKVYMNRHLAQRLGYTPEGWLALPMLHAVADSHKQAIAQMHERLARSTDTPPPLAFEISLRHRDGFDVHGEGTVGRVLIPGGQLLVFLVREITFQHQAQLSLLEADRLALVGALAAGFAHETNNPLTSVLLNLRSLRKQVQSQLTDASQATALRCLDDITAGAERIASNVRALQTLATRSATRSIDLASVVSSVLRLAAPTLEPRANVIRQIFPVAPVAGEESRLGQAVLAMLLFSSSGFEGRASATSNRIVVAVEERDGAVVVEVSDNGRDLTDDETQHAFDPFFRSAVRGAGVGVGLGVARSVVITLGGEVALARRDGGGAVITMRLPPAG